MTQFAISETARQHHAALLDAVLPLVIEGQAGARIELIDQTESGHSARGGAFQIGLGKGSRVALDQTGAHIELTYSDHDPNAASAALTAAIAARAGPVAGDAATHALLALATRLAASTIPVLIEGPTGTGKEVLARFIHSASNRSQGPFIAINCAAMPESMLEAMLFGHRKGAFTGASEAGEGFFRAADGGTLLLDEIGEMPIELQAKLLRSLQEGEVVPIGATRPVKVDVRIIASTNRDLPAEVATGRFREDLFYRLNVFPLLVPALRERPGDIAPLAFAMLLRHSEHGQGPAWIDREALRKLAEHPWPGNVRELENVIRRAIVLAGGVREIAAVHVSFDAAVRVIAPTATDREMDQRSGRLADIAFRSEADAILETLAHYRGHRARTAARLGISERTLRYRLADMRSAGLALAGAH